jgi:NADH-quinone oxidoreductase subunit C
VTDSPSDAQVAEEAAGGDDGGDLAAFAARVAETVGARSWSADHGNVKVVVDPPQWTSTIAAARDDLGLDFFSWLSAVDWSRDVVVGDPPEDVDDLDEHFEVLCRLTTVSDGSGVVFSTSLDKDAPEIASLVDLFGGAAWHEREAYEMFGIEFTGHPNLVKLYLPDAFEGHPLRKSYPLLSREVKPWPGIVDVEDMPSTENTEAGEGGEDAS